MYHYQLIACCLTSSGRYFMYIEDDVHQDLTSEKKKFFLCQASIRTHEILLLIVLVCTVNSAHEVTSIKQSPVLKGHLFLVLS